MYFAGPIDYGTQDSAGRQSFIDVMATQLIVYDATSTFRAPGVEKMSEKDKCGALDIHHAAVRAADVFVADMRHRSVGTPIEMWIAYECDIPVFVLYDKEQPHSLYIERCAEVIAYSWKDLTRIIVDELDYLG
jgi:hypothetical protein